MPPMHNLAPSDENATPARRRRADVAREIRRVDAAIEALSNGTAKISDILYGNDWHVIGDVSLPIAVASLRRYRQRLARTVR